MDGESIRLVKRSWGETKCECCPLSLCLALSYSTSVQTTAASTTFFFPKQTRDLRPEGSNVFVFNCSCVHKPLHRGFSALKKETFNMKVYPLCVFY